VIQTIWAKGKGQDRSILPSGLEESPITYPAREHSTTERRKDTLPCHTQKGWDIVAKSPRVVGSSATCWLARAVPLMSVSTEPMLERNSVI
jgi:hypothetical protein